MLKNIDHTYKFKTVLPESVRQTRLKGKRNFSNLMHITNSAFLPSTEVSEKTLRVGFLLLEHCSMMAFTAAVDALMTANLVGMASLFSFTTYGISSAKVKSDLGIEISTQVSLNFGRRNTISSKIVQYMTIFCELQSADPVEKQHIQHLFQALNLQTDCWLRSAQ